MFTPPLSSPTLISDLPPSPTLISRPIAPLLLPISCLNGNPKPNISTVSAFSLSSHPPAPPSSSVHWSFEQSYGSIESVIATHYSPIPTYSWDITDSMSTVVPETQISVNPSCSPLSSLSQLGDLSFYSTLESINAASDVDPFLISTVVPETRISVNPSCSPLPSLSQSADLSFNSTLESIDAASDIDPFPISTIVPETLPTARKGRYNEEEE